MLSLSVLLPAVLRVGGMSITKVGSRPPVGAEANVITVEGVGSLPFDPAKMKTWHYEESARSPLLTAQPPANRTHSCPDPGGNIYNANCVNNGMTDWNCFFGGWDGVASCHDSISLTVTGNSFTSLNRHVPAVATGTMWHVNNPSALKVGVNKWLMVYTQAFQQDGAWINKPGISSSPDGVVWSPNSGGGGKLIEGSVTLALTLTLRHLKP